MSTVKALIDFGADINEVGKTTLLSCAAHYGHVKIVELLLQLGMDINGRSRDNGTALHGAAEYDQVEVVEVLQKHGCDVNAQDDNRQTALHNAAWNGFHRTVEVLLKNGAKVNLKGFKGQTALHKAVDLGHRKVVEMLLAHKADCNLKDDYGKSPISLTNYSKSDRDSKLSLRLAAKEKVNGIEELTRLNFNFNSSQRNELKSDYDAIFDMLLANGAKINLEKNY